MDIRNPYSANYAIAAVQHLTLTRKLNLLDSLGRKLTEYTTQPGKVQRFTLEELGVLHRLMNYDGFGTRQNPIDKYPKNYYSRPFMDDRAFNDNNIAIYRSTSVGTSNFGRNFYARREAYFSLHRLNKPF